jgi:hypothetical protein
VSTLIVGSGQNYDGGGVGSSTPLLTPNTTYSVAVGAAGGNVSTFAGSGSGFTIYADGWDLSGTGTGASGYYYQAEFYLQGGQAGSRGNGDTGSGATNEPAFGGNGGPGASSSITGVTKIYGGGAGGSSYSIEYYYNPFTGEPDYSIMNSFGGYDGYPGGDTGPNTGFSGQAGVVILSIPTARYSGVTTGSPVVTTSGSNTILQFNSSGSYTA